MAAGKVAEGCAAFDESYKLEARVTTLANLANCREKNGQLATAIGHFTALAAELRDTDDAAGRELRDLANQRVAALSQRVSRLELQVAQPDLAGLEILRNGVIVEPGRWPEAIQVDGGTYEIVARAPGHVTWTHKVTVAAESDVQSIGVPALLPEAAATKVEPTAPVEPPRRSLVLPVSLGVAAVVLGGVAFGVDLTARSLQSDAENAASGGNLLGAKDFNDRANSRRDLAQGIGVAAGLCAGAAIVTYFVGRGGSSSSQAASRRVEPIWGAGTTGLALAGSF